MSPVTEKQFRPFLFSYEYEGERYGLQIKAISLDDARARLQNLATATYDETAFVNDTKIGPDLYRIAQFAHENRLSADAVFLYFQIGQLAAAQCRQVNDAEHGDNFLTDERGEPVTKR